MKKIPFILLLIALHVSGISTAQDDEIFRIIPQLPKDKLESIAFNSAAPIQSDTLRESELIELRNVIKNLKYDIRYASTRNFMGMQFYSSEMAFLQRPAAEALRKAAVMIEKKGYGFVIYDAYRPWYVTKMFWEATPDSLRTYVADPSNGSRHNRGCAIDLGLYDLSTGSIVSMPSGYDEFTERAHADYQGAEKEHLKNREFLRAAMESVGFSVYPYEWWHFDFKDWKEYRIENLRFEQLSSRESHK